MLPGVTLNWRELRDLRISLNGVVYRDSLGALFDTAFTALEPARFEGLGVTAHGDAHNANIWYEETHTETPGPPRLTLFDPAFAGTHVPALLAEVKPTFHNIFAHPYWLYEPEVAATRFQAKVERRGDVLVIETDWALSPLRTAFLERKGALLWRPLLAVMQARGPIAGGLAAAIEAGAVLLPDLGDESAVRRRGAQSGLLGDRARHCRDDGQRAHGWGRGRALGVSRRDRTKWFSGETVTDR